MNGVTREGLEQPAGAAKSAGAASTVPTVAREGLDLWEVFVRARRGLSHQHVGSLHAPDAEIALRRARDLYTRRGEGVSIWVVPASAVSASDPGEKEPYFTPARDKDYRYPTYYELPKEVRGL